MTNSKRIESLISILMSYAEGENENLAMFRAIVGARKTWPGADDMYILSLISILQSGLKFGNWPWNFQK